jgi:hypothetical protein
MDNNEILKPLAEILARAQELVQLAQADDWVAMEVAVANYQQHMAIMDDAEYLTAIKNAHLIEEAKAIILQIQNLNSDLDTYTVLQREKVASELRQMSQSHKALDAYGR